ncbi:4-hydroxy-tetrahydrodipicolinate synthase [Clostridium thermarum]|uniref:4-hydroxy-tetrahydrodipicolinate synthase n=1 Tax=Clostridium thermarum TaxID=1716543 RepID=UPI0011220874|nr:4-hydroxy-tetrahydrodipicolinate synthase [Clostridium thermarum]
MSIFKGSGVAIVTPFDETGVNLDKLKELIEDQIKAGTDAIIICGTTGEASTMTEAEKKEAIKFTVEVVNKRVPVIAGTGTNNTSVSVKMSVWAESMGVDGLLVITPYYNRTTQKGLVAHFGEIATSVKIPLILYNVPSRTGMNLLPQTIEELTKYDNIVAVKEASGDIGQVAKIKALCGDRIAIYSGNDDQIIPILALGGSGVISVAANIIPKKMHELCHEFFKGNFNKSLELQLKYLSLINALFIENNPIPVKTAMNLMGMNVGKLRLPLCDMSESNLNILKGELKKHGLI